VVSPVTSINKIEPHDINEILFGVKYHNLQHKRDHIVKGNKGPDL
jgi:hypothetical protein